jgi:protein-arginine kinase activator protein McsA
MSKKHSKIQELVHQKAAKGGSQFNSKKLLGPVLKACGIMRMRKNIHDVDDHTITTHNLKKDQKSIEEKCPTCEHCGGRQNLRAHNQSGELCCGACYKGKGVTASRKIMNDKNSEDLHTSTNPMHKEKAENYRNYIFKDNNPVQPLVGGEEHRHANEHWNHIRETAKPYFRKHPDSVIHGFMKHRITEPLSDSYTHNLKNAALIGGKLHSMLEIEKRHMNPEYYDNLKHNYAYHLAHLPHGKGKLKSRNVIGCGESFPTVAQNIHNAKSETKELCADYI